MPVSSVARVSEQRPPDGGGAGAVRVASLLLLLEGAAITVVGTGYGAAAVLGEPLDRTGTLLEASMAVALGVAVLLLARGVGRVRGWARSAAVTVQLLALPVGFGALQSGVWWLAAVVLGLAGAVLYQLATPDARLAFREQA